MLPEQLQSAIEQELTNIDRKKLSRAAERITSDYQDGRFGGSLASPEAHAAYLVTRLPATYAANLSVFREIARRVPTFAPVSLLDLGAGPGTSSWAASNVWKSLAEITQLESNRALMAIGQRLASAHHVLGESKWEQRDLSNSTVLPAADLVVLSYSAGELTDASGVISRAWQAAEEVLVLIEPGTPKNFDRIVRWRSELIAAGGHVVAPCPHHNACPMAVAGDWCHFATRLERSAEHRRLKGGALGYEDEKFSYIAFSKQPIPLPAARIVRHPLTYSGYIRLTLCTPEGLKEQTVTRSRKEAFRAARKAKWGDTWDQFE